MKRQHRVAAALVTAAIAAQPARPTTLQGLGAASDASPHTVLPLGRVR